MNPVINFYQIDITNPELLKGKIIKTYCEEYDIDEQGNTSYGDSPYSSIIINYYFFDQNAALTDKYSIIKNSNNYTLYKNKYHYTQEENNYIETTYDYEEEKTEIKNYKILENKDKLVLEYKNPDPFYNLTETITVKGNVITVSEQKHNRDPYIKEYTFENEKVTSKDFSGTTLYRTMIYNHGLIVDNIQEGYKFIYQLAGVTEFNKDFSEGIKKTKILEDGKVVEEKITGIVTRKYSEEGFLLESNIKPYNKKAGSYTFFSEEILNTPDDFFTKTFK